MAGILDRVRNLMLGADDEEVVYEDYDEEIPVTTRDSVRDYEKPRERERVRDNNRDSRDITDLNYVRNQRTGSSSSKIVDFQTSVMMQVVIARPNDIQDAFSICDCVRENKACVVNLEGVERENAQRIADFLGGVSYSFNGEIQRISSDIFMIAPANVHISSELKEELRSSGLHFPLLNATFGK